MILIVPSMKYISNEDILALKISPTTCIEWAREAFALKPMSQLPPKVSLHPRGNDFFNTMPCILPEEYHTYGCKIVSRVKGQHPALSSEIVVFDTLTGKLTAVMGADWITAMRTGAVASLAITTLQRKNASVYSFVGLGVVGNTVIEYLLAIYPEREITIRLKRYKDHAEAVVRRFASHSNVHFEIVDDMESLVNDADVVVSSITDADGLLVADESLFKPGVLVVPIHTRGFQNCDRVFDRVIADDENHVCGFKYFKEFRSFGELGDVLSGNIEGRTSDDLRILAYNIGLGLFDVYYAYKILRLVNEGR